MSWFECVPNFSEGRDEAKIGLIVAAGADSAGVTVLDAEQNADHNRCVVTLVGGGPDIVDAVFHMMQVATSVIDLTTHQGEHPRMGATDVVPFVALGEATTEQAVARPSPSARGCGRNWVFPSTSTAMPPVCRTPGPGQSALRAVRGDPRHHCHGPGPASGHRRAGVHPTAGVVAVGARPVLIAYNAYLTTADVAVAKRVAKAVRARDGGLAEVKALGFDIRERQRAQVSMNLTDYRRTPIHRRSRRCGARRRALGLRWRRPRWSVSCPRTPCSTRPSTTCS